MNKIELPIDGIIDYNEKRKLNVRLRKGENGQPKLELLDNIGGFWGFYNNTLKCHFAGRGHKYNVTFLNCSKCESVYNPEIEFSGYISYSNFKDTDDSTFIDTKSLREKICFRIENLEKWLYPHIEIGENKQISFVDENNTEQRNKNSAKYLRIKILNKSISANFKYNNENFILSIIDEFDGDSIDYPKIEIYPYCYLELSGENPHNIIFYKKLINKIKKLFSLFFHQVANVTSLYEFKKYEYRIDYHILKECEDKYFHSDFNIFYKYITNQFSEILQKWIDFYDEYELIINSLCNYENPRALSDNINKKSQLLETYGNIITKGQNTREDIKSALSELSPENYAKIFHINKSEKDWITFELDVRDFGDTCNKQIGLLSAQIMNLRNHATHPYKSGKLKTPQDSNLSEQFTYGNSLNTRAIYTLCECLDEALTILLLQKLSIDKYYKKF